MGKYTPNYNDLEVVPDLMTSTGRTARENVRIEEGRQRVVAELSTWLLAKKVNHDGKKYCREDSRQILNELGFRILGEESDLFYSVEPPKGWERSTEGYWTKVIDENKRERIQQFYKGAFYDREAFLNISLLEKETKC
ncbi:hypothetical protein J4408_00875 [Candidatus Pacearchaeota archaeon]|nr:hypothetical protein [Candidatus Pacearchaeota archaeon]